MIKLTNHQIRSKLEAMQGAYAVEVGRGRGQTAAQKRRLARIAEYRAELARREAAGENPGTDKLQDVLFGESRKEPS